MAYYHSLLGLDIGIDPIHSQSIDDYKIENGRIDGRKHCNALTTPYRERNFIIWAQVRLVYIVTYAILL